MFYHYVQNNSGGDFYTDDRVCHHVIIEADAADAADIRAEAIGIYFNGVKQGLDCECCGDRWYPAYSGNPVPLLYGRDPEKYCDMFTDPGEVYCRVFYADGRVVEYHTLQRKNEDQ